MSSTPRTGHFKRSSDGLEISVTKVVECLEDPHPVITINTIPTAHHPYGPGAMAPHGTQVGMLDSHGDSYDARSIGSAV